MTHSTLKLASLALSPILIVANTHASEKNFTPAPSKLCSSHVKENVKNLRRDWQLETKLARFTFGAGGLWVAVHAYLGALNVRIDASGIVTAENRLTGKAFSDQISAPTAEELIHYAYQSYLVENDSLLPEFYRLVQAEVPELFATALK